MDIVLSALVELMSTKHLLYLSIGVGLGLIIGILPGLGGIVGLSLTLPFIYGMEPGPALALMIGLTAVTATSDTFPAILMGIPGSAAGTATVLDGFALSQKGQAARALSASFTSSLIGGLIGAVVLTGAIFVAKPLILAIGFGEQMMLVILALTMVGVLSGDSAAKGLSSCCVGLLLGAVGESYTTATMRLGFDNFYLLNGLPLSVVALGVFALPEVIDLLRRRETISRTGSLGVGWVQGFKDAIHHRWIIVRCSIIGCTVGLLPGLSGSVIEWISYGHVVQFARDKSLFGKGDIRGVIGPESANNAKEGGSLVPTMLFGIPGSGTMAIFLGGLLIIGIEPGPRFLSQSPNLAFVMVWSIAIGNILGAGACILVAQPVAKLTTIRYSLVAPFIIVLVFFAAFQSTQDWGDLVVLLALTTLGIFMKRFGWSRPALLIGFVLSKQLEMSVYHTYTAYGLSFLQRPIAVVILVITLASLALAIHAQRKAHVELGEAHQAGIQVPQLSFATFLALVPIWAIYDSWGRPFSMALFPMLVGFIALIPLATILWRLAVRRQPHVVFYDEEHEVRSEGTTRSPYEFLIWLFALLSGCTLIGFVFAVAVFMMVFTRTQAKTSYLGSFVATSAITILLAALGHILKLRYPLGLLQDFVPMPWPFLT